MDQPGTTHPRWLGHPGQADWQGVPSSAPRSPPGPGRYRLQAECPQSPRRPIASAGGEEVGAGYSQPAGLEAEGFRSLPVRRPQQSLPRDARPWTTPTVAGFSGRAGHQVKVRSADQAQGSRDSADRPRASAGARSARPRRRGGRAQLVGYNGCRRSQRGAPDPRRYARTSGSRCRCRSPRPPFWLVLMCRS